MRQSARGKRIRNRNREDKKPGGKTWRGWGSVGKDESGGGGGGGGGGGKKKKTKAKNQKKTTLVPPRKGPAVGGVGGIAFGFRGCVV